MKLTYISKGIKRKNGIYNIIVPDNISKFVNNQCYFYADRKALNSIMMSVLVMLEEKNTIICKLL